MHQPTNMIHTHPRPWKRTAAAQLIALAGVLLPALCLGQTPPAYTVSTVAGTGTIGYSGDAGDPLLATLSGPTSVYVDSKGNLYITDQLNSTIRLVSSGKITSVVGIGTSGFSGDAAAATAAQLNYPGAVLFDAKGNLYVSDTQNEVIRMVTSAGTISTIAGSQSLGAGDLGDGAAATSAQLNSPTGLALDSAGNLYIADSRNGKIRKLTGTIISTFAGTGTLGFLGNGGPATAAHLNLPSQIAMDSHDVLYIADSLSHQVRKISGGVITLVAGTAGKAGFSGDGASATSALLNTPRGVAVDAAGNVYIADSNNQRIRVVTPDGIIHTIAGTGTVGYTGDGAAALSAQMAYPAGISLDSAGNLYVADFQNNVVRKLTVGGSTGGPGTPPAIKTGGVVSASDFGQLATVAPGSWIEIYGTNLATTTRQWTTGDFTGIMAPSSLARTTVTIGGQSAFIDYVSPGQVNAQVPGTIGTGPLPLTVSTAAGSSATYTVTTALQSPGLYAPAAYTTLGKQYVGALFTDYKTFAFPAGAFSGVVSRPAKPGEIVIIYGIGFGPVPGNPPGQIAQASNGLTLALAPKFYFGSTQAQVQYAGIVDQTVGLYQFNVIVPNVPNSDAVALTFSVNIGGTDVAGQQPQLYIAVHQ